MQCESDYYEVKKCSTTTHFGFYDWPLQLHINQNRHMQLVISELINPCHFPI
jgi:hypothetical protein